MQMIIEHGLGLYGMELPYSRPAKQSVSKITIHPGDDYKRLVKRNEFDMKLWEEAKKLNNINMISLERLAKLQQKRVMNSEQCCGFVCK